MAYKVIILYRLYMPSYFLGTFTEYPDEREKENAAFLFYDFLRLMIYPVIRLHNTPNPAKKIKTSVPLPKTV